MWALCTYKQALAVCCMAGQQIRAYQQGRKGFELVHTDVHSSHTYHDMALIPVLCGVVCCVVSVCCRLQVTCRKALGDVLERSAFTLRSLLPAPASKA